MPRDLPLSNGNLLVNFDRDYNIRDIFYPYVGKANQSNGCISRTGCWVEGRFSWLSDSSWIKDMRYMSDTLATNVIATNDDLQLRLVINDVVDFYRDVFLRRVEVFNLGSHRRDIRLFFHYDFQFWEVGRGDSIHYHPDEEVLIAYKDNCYLLANAAVGDIVGISSWTTGIKGGQGADVAWNDAEDGVLKENPSSFGSVDGVIAVDKHQLAPGESAVLYTWLAAAEDHEGVHLLDSMVRQRTAEYFVTRTVNYWRAWVRGEEIRFHDLPEAVADFYNRSLLVLRTNIDNRGGIIAANDSDLSELVYGRETYSYVWPRDGGYIANALDRAGYSHLARSFYHFCQGLIYYEPGQDSHTAGHQKTAYMLHKYSPDGSIASNWMPYIGEDGTALLPIQEDETAVIPYSLWQHYLKHKDVETITPLYRPLIVDAAAFMSEFRDPHTKLPAPSFDLWEERRAIYSYTVATVWAGLSAAANFAELFGELADAEKFRRAATEIKEACEVYLYDDKEGRFLKSISVHPDGSVVPDNTVESSLYGLWYFGMFEPNDPRIVRTMKAIEDRLWCQTDIGGLARYEGDKYHWDRALDQQREKIPGNPWIISTLWLAQYRIARAESLDDLNLAVPVIEWVCDRALPSGVLAEQIHPLTGEPLSVSPLTWSHATVVSTVLDYVDKYEQLQGRAQRG